MSKLVFSLARVRSSGREFISEVGNSHFFFSRISLLPVSSEYPLKPGVLKTSSPLRDLNVFQMNRRLSAGGPHQRFNRQKNTHFLLINPTKRIVQCKWSTTGFTWMATSWNSSTDGKVRTTSTRVKERIAVVTTRLTLPQQYMHAKKPNYLILPDLPRLHQHSSPGDIHRSSLEINDHTYK